jgi:(p)ppGpp synthase/HD superfamily hydrolase
LTSRFHEAARYASELHARQARKGGQIPYVSHVFAVCGIVLEHGGTESEAIAALLHDGPEDQGGLATLAHIRSAFGDDVADIVEACSDSLVDTSQNGARKEAWATRKARYVAHLKTANASTLLVSAADKLHNARSIESDVLAGHDVFARFSAPRDAVLANYRAMIDAYEKGAADVRRVPIVERLRSIIERLGDA